MNTTPQRTVTEWSLRIWTASTKTAESIIALGQEFLEAKADLGHGHFGRLFPKHRDAIANPVPYSQDKAERLMRIAKSLAPYPAHVRNLPKSVRALFRLVRLPAHKRHGAIVDGLVHPAMREREVVALGQSQAPWSPDTAYERLRRATNLEIVKATPASAHLLTDILQRLTEETREATRPELRDAVRIARDELDLHDYEPGGYRIFESAAEASTHPGAPTVVASCKSTNPNWYKELTTYKPGVPLLRRKQVDACFADIEACKLPKKTTERTHFAVVWAIKDNTRTSPLGRGGFAP
jgi:hypothetical protein